MIKTIYRFIRECGINLRKISGIIELPSYFIDLKNFKKQNNNKDWKIIKLHPCLHDKKQKAGDGDGVYFRQDLLVAKDIFVSNPKKHIDIGSRIDGFVAHVASFREIEIFDIRPLKNIYNIIFKQMDITELPKDYENYTDSISCLHSLEHFGLGRYGDKLDVDSYKKGFQNLVKMLKPNGVFYFSVPIGKQCIEFNAHRVFSKEEILRLIKINNLKIMKFDYITTGKSECGIWKLKKIK